ncbi:MULTISPECIES: hypothetical protein [unclassified Synechocystis]|uniref:hypothetical protein n=1 Tax=unclassified Synechocystis TaxID=2640012 RepID=UPI0004D1662E|nr:MULTISPECIES: hypothetical protein [unclassified Synechocystis]AIE73033.1 hypothetical protein D082_05040 [Synechocystis sp. PCC 6714]MCT0253551.1 hypothetical protein [Synechocystis sp. CS-94]
MKNKIIFAFIIICLIHFAEHIFQLSQLYLLGWERPDCLGLLGVYFPELMRSQWLHFLYAVIMEIGLYVFLSLFGLTALMLQTLHLGEHTILLATVPNPWCIGEIWFPRIELHFFYNLVVLIPMMVIFSKRKNLLSRY